MVVKQKSIESTSAKLYRRAKKVMPGGCSRNTILRRSYPIYVSRGRGCKVTDVDGKEYVDFSNNMASLIHGHANPAITKAVSEQLRKGTAFMMATEAELAYAEHLCGRSLNFDSVRFMNSGTEAVMTCIKAARAFTGRPKIAKVEGAYHGLYDYAEVSQTSNPLNWGPASNPKSNPVAEGTPRAALNDVVVIPFNDEDRSEKILDRHAKNVACILIDPIPHRVGLVPAAPSYLRMLKRWVRNNGALVVFDEVVTFRAGYGGAQGTFGVKPDLTALGKMIGGGFPVGAVGGRRAVMDVMNPLKKNLRLPQAGTFSANPVTMTAGRVAMELFDQVAVDQLNDLGERLRENIRSAILTSRAEFSVTGYASMFRIHAKPQAPRSYREAYPNAEETRLLTSLLDTLIGRGYLLINTGTGMLSTAMDDAVIDRFSQICLDSFRDVSRGRKL